MRNFSLAFLLVLLLSACVWEEPWVPIPRAYYQPVYTQSEQSRETRVGPPQRIENPGRIYVKDQLLLVVDQHRGIHLIDNTDPESPKPLSFIEISGATNLAVYGHHLYTNNLGDLVTLDIQNLEAIREVSRVSNALKAHLEYPPFTNVAFECVDPALGTVIGWQEAPWPEEDPECRR